MGLIVGVLPRLAGPLINSVLVTPDAGPLTVSEPVNELLPASDHVPLSRFAGESVMPPAPERLPASVYPKLPARRRPLDPINMLFANCGSTGPYPEGATNSDVLSVAPLAFTVPE